MFGKQVTLFKLFGFEIRIDMSWAIIAVLITWSLAQSVFPYYYKGLPISVYWWMGIWGALGLFASIIFHELSHCLVARKFDLQIRGITLFIFGGVAEMEEEPKSAKAEFFMAIAGPLSSILLGFLFFGIYIYARESMWTEPVTGVFSYLWYINFLLAAFNLLPVFPLDGGRVFRSVLWSWKNNVRWATRIASRIGSGFGLLLIFLGVLSVIRGSFVSGIWWFLIGLFLRDASRMSYKSLLMRRALEGESVKCFMKSNPVTAPTSISIDKFVEDYIYKHHFKMFPIVDDGKLIGCISTREVKDIPQEEWSQHTVGEFSKPCSSINTIAPETDAMKALSIMHQTGKSRLMVVESNRLVGIVVLKDLLKFLSLKLDLEEGNM